MKKSKGELIFQIFNVIFMLILCVFMFYPYLNQLAVSFNDSADTALGGITIFPRKFTFANYRTVFNDSAVSRAFVISLSRTVLNVVLAVVVTFAAAYALTRRDLLGRRAITRFLAVPGYISAGIIPIYILYRYLGLINNYFVYIIPFCFSFYNMVIFRSFIQEIPDALEEAAIVDGANEIQVMFKIIIPVALPVLATVALWVAVGQWNDWTTNLYYITDSKYNTLQYLIMKIIKQGEQLKADMIMSGGDDEALQRPTSEAVKAAMLIITTVPIICTYPFLQKYFVKGVTVGAVKG